MPCPAAPRRNIARSTAATPALLLALTLAAPALAVERNWIGGGGAWQVPENWSPSGAPEANDSARITSGASMLAIDAIVGALLLDGGSIAGPGNLDVSADAEWGSGAQSGSGQTSIGRTLTLFGTFDKIVSGGRQILAGDTVWHGSTGNNGRLIIGTGSRFVNTGLFRAEHEFDSRMEGDGLFANQGRFELRSDTAIAAGTVFDNRGSVDVQAGRLSLGGGGEHLGSFAIAAGSRLVFDGGTHVFRDGATIGGDGTVEQQAGVLAFDAGARIDGSTPLDLSGGRLQLAAAQALDSFQQHGGIVEGPGMLTVSGPAEWRGGAHRDAAETRFDGALTLDGTGDKTISDGRHVLAVDTTWQGSTGNNGRVVIATASRFTSTGVFREAQEFDSRIEGAGRFVNQGRFEKTSDATTTLTTRFDNAGHVAVAAGQLRVAGDGAHDGSFEIAAGGRLAFDGGTHVFHDGAAIGGAGILEQAAGILDFEAGARIADTPPLELSGGLLRLAESQTVGSLTQSSGIVEGPGDLIVAGPAEWRGGAHRDAAVTRFDGPLTLDGTTDKTISGGRQVVAGDSSWRGSTGNNSRLVIGTDSRFTNSGVFREAQKFASRMEGAGRFVNRGRFEKTSDTLTVIGPVFDNPGRIEVLAGTLELSSAFDNAGIVSVADGARFAAASTFDNGGTLTGDGSFASRAGRGIVNRGRIEPGTHGTGSLAIDGDLALETGGVLAFELTSTSDFDRLLVDGIVSIGGELSILQLGYVPRLADSFVLASFSAAVGSAAFESISWAGFADGVAFTASIHPDSITLTVTAVPEPGQYLMMLAGLALITGVARRRRGSGR